MSDAQPHDDDSGSQLRQQFESQLSEKDREIAFLRAGIDTTTPLGKLFADGYRGEITADKVKEAWTAIQPAAPAAPSSPAQPAPESTPAPAPAPTDNAAPAADEVAVFDEAGRLASGATVPGADAGPDPQQAAVDDYWKAKREGKSDKDAEALGFDRIFDAAVKNDPRVVIAGGRKGSDD